MLAICSENDKSPENLRTFKSDESKKYQSWKGKHGSEAYPVAHLELSCWIPLEAAGPVGAAAGAAAAGPAAGPPRAMVARMWGGM